MQTTSRMNDIYKGLNIYERIVNRESVAPEELPALAAELGEADETGQYLCSAARYLAAVDIERHRPVIDELARLAIERDRERKYIGGLLKPLWGEDYADHVEELRLSDHNFRRIYKRIFQEGDHSQL